MSVVYKYPIMFGTTTSVPEGQVVHFGYDGSGALCAWIRPDTAGLFMDCYIVGTGQEFEDNDWVEKSFVTPEGYVWHLVLRVKGWYEE